MSTARGPLDQPDYKRGLLIRRAGRLPKARLTVQVEEIASFRSGGLCTRVRGGPLPYLRRTSCAHPFAS